MHQKTVIDPEEEKIYGMFYTAFRKETWWWESTVAARKIVIALIGVFGTELLDMQVHLTLMLVMFILLVTSQVRPFGGLKHGILHVLEMASLMATFLTLWAGSIFNTRPRCEDPLQGEGSTLLWCDALSIMVGLVDIVVLLAIGISFVYIKATSSPDDEGGDIKGDVEMVGFENPMKKMGEMKEMKKGNSAKKSNSNFPGHLIVAGEEKERKEKIEQPNTTNDAGRVFDNPMGEKIGKNMFTGGEVELKKEIIALKNKIDGLEKQMAMTVAGSIPSANSVAKTTPKTKTKKWKSATNKLKSVSAFKQRRRSSLMTSSTEIDLVSSVNIHVDKATGRKYSINPKTGASEWLDKTVEEAVHVDPASGRRYNSKGWL